MVVGLLQLDSLLAREDATWWRWTLLILLIGMASYYLLAWWVRGRREDAARMS